MAERPRVYKTEAIVLRRRNIGEADSILTLFSDREGKFEAVARGVRKAKSRMRGHLEPLTRSRVLLAQGRSMDVLTQAETVAPYRVLRDDLDRTAAALYCAELVDSFVAEHASQPGLYERLVVLLEGLDSGAPGWLARHFELRLLTMMGYDLQVEACATCGGALPEEPALFAPAAGGLVCRECRSQAGSGRIASVRAIKVLRYGKRHDAAEFAALMMAPELEDELSGLMGDSVRYVLEREPRTQKFVDVVAALGERTGRPASSVVESKPCPDEQD